jgi:general stress protein 26
VVHKFDGEFIVERSNNLLNKVFNVWYSWILVLCVMTVPMGAWAQEKQAPTPERDSLITAAIEIIEAARYCALITIDQSGRPQVRTMDPFPPEEDMVIWLGTISKSRKVREIRNDPRVTLYYADPEEAGYVVIAGIARLIDDAKEKARLWKEEWETYFPDRKDSYILIKVTPERLNILNYRHGITGDPVTWRIPSVEFKAPELKD